MYSLEFKPATAPAGTYPHAGDEMPTNTETKTQRDTACFLLRRQGRLDMHPKTLLPAPPCATRGQFLTI